MDFMRQFTVVVPAAGIGSRMQAECPKQYLKIAGKTIIEHTLENLLSHPQIKQAIVVLNPQDSRFKQLAISQQSKVKTVIGGEERCDSVLAGLHSVEQNEEWVLVHDAARPCLSQSDLTALLALAETGHVGGILAAPVRDTMKRSVKPNNQSAIRVEKTEPRENLWHALTPQFFKLAKLKFALQQAQATSTQVTDEASAMEAIGEEVRLVLGQSSNIKVTQPEDLLLAEFYLTHLT
ncbi:2-C-methyl-D-erythritol 4-phosphate cytidylyltransferase [Paraglaciecola aestuariivivens]